MEALLEVLLEIIFELIGEIFAESFTFLIAFAVKTERSDKIFESVEDKKLDDSNKISEV